jgi:hypothetical protein
MNSGFSGFAKNAQYTWDVMQMQWNIFLLKYDLDLQGRILKKLGWRGSVTRFLGSAATIGFLGFVITLSWTLWRRSHREDKALMTWRKFCARLEKSGVARRLNEGPLQFAERAARMKPGKSKEIHAIAALFTQIRYGTGITPGAGAGSGTASAAVKKFRSSVRRFSL